MKEQPFKVYVTKYCLSAGIEYLEVTKYGDNSVKELDRWGRVFLNGDCFVNKEDAIFKAHQMKAKRIASLEKQIKKVNAIDFGKV